MQVVLLCGGMGTRLREETEYRPKPMVQIGARPILWHIMRHYSTYGCNRFLLCTGYKGGMIKDYFLNYRQNACDVEIDLGSGDAKLLDAKDEELPWTVRIQDTGIETLTGTRLKRALRYIDDDVFLATYGDGVANVEIDALVEHHKRSGKLATVTAVRPSSRFGELDIVGDTVSSFIEKPQTTEGWINGGFFVLNKKVFDDVGDEENITLEQGVLESLAARRELNVYRHTGFWQCMDTYRELCLLEEYWQKGNAPWKTW
ncbi:glucose-1-phosphate cytidylyltransferase [Sphingosinicella microcystinivorans]|uniref:glucose-1-phosphate cytidylyltransferase n=1 Tax=Sphingosinicella microcystinivorans TaxID=335406 RepID=UPI0022F3D320|nr:glucose-1-phosphate cytidylyltransferase [Sphingosinicella microcystinivorans]WBX83206.1 glucose-1-phosphate cytidylyltransferase [Sphingosinicella microcystinivorans]